MGYALYFLEKKTVFTGQSRQLNVAVISRSVSQSAIKTESRDKVPAYRQAFDRPSAGRCGCSSYAGLTGHAKYTLYSVP